MLEVQGKTIVKGHGKGPALFTDQAVNFTAAFTKTANLIPFKKAEFNDRHHPWFKKNVKGKVLVVPAAIGSTHTGLVLLDLTKDQNGPAAIIIEHPDPLLVSGVLLSEVWYEKTMPIVQYPIAELMAQGKDGDTIEVDGNTGTIRLG